MAVDTPDPHVLAPGRAPTPFTADEIRAATPVGKTIRRVVDVPGEPPIHRTTRYVECDDSGATLEQSLRSPDGSLLEEPELDRVTWLELQSHSSFPADRVTIEPDHIVTPLGELDCVRYTVRDGSTERSFWFATDFPGMPIHYVTRVDGQVVSTVTVVANTLT